MKKFRFRLDKVQRVRQLQEDRAKVELQAANRLLAAAEAEQQARLDAYAATAGAAATGPAADAWRAQRSRRDLAARSALGAIAQRDVARAAVEERRIEWTDRRRRVEALERLRERRREEWMGELTADQERLVDDLVAANRIRAAVEAARDAARAERRARQMPAGVSVPGARRNEREVDQRAAAHFPGESE